MTAKEEAMLDFVEEYVREWTGELQDAPYLRDMILDPEQRDAGSACCPGGGVSMTGRCTLCHEHTEEAYCEMWTCFLETFEDIAPKRYNLNKND